MPANIREIKGRIKAVGNIQRITKTMQLIASSRFQKMQKSATRSQAYTEKIREMVGELAAALGTSGDISHPLIASPDKAAGRELVLILTSERGLCGAYNGNVMRTATTYMRGDDGRGTAGTDVEIVGKKGIGYAKFNRIDLEESYTHFGDQPKYADVAELAERYIADFTAGKYDAVKVVYMKFITRSRQAPVVETLLPLRPPAAGRGQGDEGTRGPGEESTFDNSTPRPLGTSAPATVYEFSPDAETLLAELLPVTVKTSLYQSFLDAVVSEQLARMVAMKSATDAAGKQKKSLNRQFNRARQTAITTELSEIIGGAAALE